MPHLTPRPGDPSPDSESTAHLNAFPSRRSLRAPAVDTDADLAPTEVSLRRAGRRVRTVDAVPGEAQDAGGSPVAGVPAADGRPSAPSTPSAPRSRREARQPARQDVAASTVAAVRPHSAPAGSAADAADGVTASARRAGRRASGTSSDGIQRPAGGRRAIVSTPTTAIPIITPELIARSASATPSTVTVRPLDDVEVDVVRVPGESSPAAPQTPLVPEPPVGARAADAPVLPAAAPVRRARRARTDAEGNVVVDPPVPAPADPAAATARPKSGRRRASAPAGPPAAQPGADQNPSDQPPLGRRARRATIVRVGVSTLGMLFAAGLAIGTSLPASVFSASALDSGMTLADVAPGLESQGLITTADGGSSAVTRDDYSVTDLKQVAAAAGIRMANTFVNDPTSAVQWPFPVGVPISDGFGPRESPGGIGSTDHKGVDFTPGQGTTIQAIADGVVSTVVPYDGGGLGVYVIIDHVVDGQTVSSVYGHMLSGSIELEVGQAVKVGQAVGRVGNTGTSTGAHLHLEIRLNGTTPVDPYAWLQAHVGA